MSLLLQALQKAAKNREGSSSEENSGEEHRTSVPETQASLTLEALVEPQLASEPESSTPASKTGPTPEYAANVLSASESPSYTVLDWIGDHHMLSFLAATAVFAICYGTYVYIQVSHPSAFRSVPTAPTSPIQSATVTPPISTTSVQARVSGMPADASESSTMPVVAEMAGSDDAFASKGQSKELETRSELREKDTSSSKVATPPNAEAAIQPVRKSRPVLTQSRPAPAQRRIAAVTDSDGVEVIEIPAGPSVSFPGKTNRGAQGKLAVRPQSTELDGINPTLLAAYDALQKGEYEKARSLYNEVLARDINDKDALLGMAAIEWKQGRTNVASQYYGRVLENDPRNSHAQAGLIAILGSADPTAAEGKLKQLIARDPSGFLYFTLGNLYGEQGQWPRAQQAYFRAFQFQPDNPDYAFNLAVGLEHLGQTKPALDYYRKALDLSFKKGRANFDQRRTIARVGQLSAQVE